MASFGPAASTARYSFDVAKGVASGSYDVIAVVQHELDQVLGRVGGLGASSLSFATTLDLFRSGDAGPPNPAHGSRNTFSANGDASGGDPGDWLTFPDMGAVQGAYAVQGLAVMPSGFVPEPTTVKVLTGAMLGVLLLRRRRHPR